jgi:ATP/maltotriose-dependent transcriptional regulator MalT
VATTLAGFEQGPAGQIRELDFLQDLQHRLGLESQPAKPDDDLHAPLEPLTARENLMVELLLAGLRNREIAARLSMSEATVKWHLYNLYSKLGVNNRTAAIHRARSFGLAAS